MVGAQALSYRARDPVLSLHHVAGLGQRVPRRQAAGIGGEVEEEKREDSGGIQRSARGRDDECAEVCTLQLCLMRMFVYSDSPERSPQLTATPTATLKVLLLAL